MKKITLISLLIIAAVNSNAQVKSKPSVKTSKEQVKPVEIADEDYNRWTLEASVGQSKGVKPYSNGFYSSQNNNILGKFDINSYSLGARYMISPKFGFKANFGYEDLKNINNNGSSNFEMIQKSITLQAVVNASHLFNIEDVIGRWGLLIHAGFQVNMMTSKTDNYAGVNHNYGRTEHNLGMIFGITPQYRMTKRLALFVDFNTANYFRQHYNWDGSFSNNSNNLNGQLLNASFGLSYSFGNQKMHGDWAEIKDKKAKEIEALTKDIQDLQTMMNDTDKDGVPDYLDQENNSVAGVAVDTKGKMVDINKNGVPDELERYLSSTYASKETINTMNADMIKRMINDGYISTYFDANKSTPTNVSTEGIDFMLTYLRNNTTESIEIIGHADEVGSSEFNQKLALDRAQAVKNILTKAKIDPSRLNIVSAGEDASVDKNSDGARKLVRRVTFRVK